MSSYNTAYILSWSNILVENALKLNHGNEHILSSEIKWCQ